MLSPFASLTVRLRSLSLSPSTSLRALRDSKGGVEGRAGSSLVIPGEARDLLYSPLRINSTKDFGSSVRVNSAKDLLCDKSRTNQILRSTDQMNRDSSE